MIDGLIRWSPGITLDAIEEQVIRMAIEFYRHNKTVTAESLGIAIRTLDARLEKYEHADQQRALEREDQKRRDAEFLDRQRGVYRGLPTHTGPAEPQGPSILCSPSGIRMESFEKDSSQSTVSMQKPEEIQELLPPKASGRHSKSAR